MRILNTTDQLLRLQVKELAQFARDHSMLFAEFIVLCEQFLDADFSSPRWIRMLHDINTIEPTK
jgi:hypothetical protein